MRPWSPNTKKGYSTRINIGLKALHIMATRDPFEVNKF